jgi:bifunctional DNA-binding transcriptional regulator/antitoxin component of YhaV-PrlF toxin-antitoxin module
MNSWTIKVEEADDGSGDLILPFPDNLLESTGWKEGDILEWIDNKNGTWILRKKDETSTDATE